jgi:serine/threonine protein kinase
MDTEKGRAIALKTIDKEKILEDNMLSAIKAEVLNMISCDHPHIVKLEAAFSTRKKFYLAMELVEGVDFVDRISTDS